MPRDARLPVLGAVFGSFLNVVAYRLPRGESLSRPARAARAAGRRSGPTTTCRSSRGCCCAGAAAPAGEPISARYPLVEAGTALLCALVVLAKGADEDALLGLALVLLLVPSR